MSYAPKLTFKCDARDCRSTAEIISPDDPADVPKVLALRGWACGTTGDGDQLHYCPAHAKAASLIVAPTE